jgi:hypothetical protein
MKEYHTEIKINAPIEKVWDLLTDFDNYPKWNPLIGWVEGRIEEGETLEMLVKPFNKNFRAVVQKVKKPFSFSWKGKRGARWIINSEHYYKLDAIDNTSTLLKHGEIFKGAGTMFVGKYIIDKIDDAFEKHNMKVKEILEGGG